MVLVPVAHQHRSEGSSDSKRRFSFGFRIPAVLIAVGIGYSCAELPSGRCAPCQNECPGDLTCDTAIGRCVEHPDDTCDDLLSSSGTETATTSPAPTNEGGAAGESTGPAAGGTGNAGSTNSGSNPNGTSTASGGNAAGGTGTSTGGGSGHCDSGACDPRILAESFGPFCAGAAIEIELQAVCSCDSEAAQEIRSFTWVFEDPPGLTHTADGILSGTLPAGSHVVKVVATTNGGAVSISRDIVIDVVEGCLVIFRSDEATPGAPYLVASRLDTEQATIVPRIAGDEASVSSFDLAPDGRYLAQLEDTAAERKLQLFDLEGNQVDHVEEVHVDQYLAHAFSPDSRWLAVVEGPADDPAASSLELIDLHAEPAVVVDEYAIEYHGGLTWSTANHVLYLARSIADPIFSGAAFESAVDDTGLAEPTEYSTTYNFVEYDPFAGFLVGKNGFLTTYTYQRCFLDREAGVCFELPIFETWSPGLAWGASREGESLEIYPLSEVYTEGAPAANIDGCETIRAWATDDETLLCAIDLKPVVYQIDPSGTLTNTALPLSGALSWQKRVAFSDTGRWLALTPKDDGLVVVPREEFGTRTLDDVMLEQIADERWDFLFSSGEDQLIVQRGPQLFVAQLDPESMPPEFVPVADDLSPPPECLAENWFPDPRAWCGAPAFRGNLVMSPDQRYLGFVNDGRVTTTDLTRDDYPLNEHGTLAPNCGSECIRFR